jgi:hypothetical protein
VANMPSGVSLKINMCPFELEKIQCKTANVSEISSDIPDTNVSVNGTTRIGANFISTYGDFLNNLASFHIRFCDV